ncbi:MAG: hypothetical protein KC586_26995, partial [Myxococcales bacterium]|nr:hypothetical protein [Myxococcales bacterium]
WLALVGCGGSRAANDAGVALDASADAERPRDSGPPPIDAARGLGLRIVTFNSGTTLGLSHERAPDDGYGDAEAALSDEYYGNGLAWTRAIEDVRRFFETLEPDVVVFQEIFHPEECEAVPVEARAGFVCDGWVSGDPSVVQRVLGPDFQIACHLDKPDKCAAVRRAVGGFRGCESALCLNGLEGARVPDCGGGSRIGRGVIELVGGGELTLVSVHGSSGLDLPDQACRVAQFRQVFEDLGLGDGPAANGTSNVILGDFNTDPVRLARLDESARYLASRAEIGAADGFRFLSEVAEGAPPTYLNAIIDHVIVDDATGRCFAAGITPGTEAPTEMVYFDHRPLVCDLDPR